MPNLDDALTYMGIDYPDDVIRSNVSRALSAAIQTMHGAVGYDVETYLPDDARVESLVLIYTNDLYSERGASAKVSNATRRLVADIELQLRMELREAKAAVL